MTHPVEPEHSVCVGLPEIFPISAVNFMQMSCVGNMSKICYSLCLSESALYLKLTRHAKRFPLSREDSRVFLSPTNRTPNDPHSQVFVEPRSI